MECKTCPIGINSPISLERLIFSGDLIQCLKIFKDVDLLDMVTSLNLRSEASIEGHSHVAAMPELELGQEILHLFIV